MSTAQAKIFAKMFSKWQAIGDAHDLHQERLSLSDYHELTRALQVISNGEVAHTFARSVAEWLQRNGAKIIPDRGRYIITI